MNRTRLRIVIAVTLAAMALGAALGERADAAHLAVNAATSGLIGLILTLFEIALQGPAREPLSRVPVALALRVAVYGGLFVAARRLNAAIGAAQGLGPDDGTFGIGITDSIALALAFNTIFVARALMGPRTLLAFATGRYHRPRREERLVLFLDLRGSTGLAERLGDLAFHRFLNRLALDLTDPIAEAEGEIYRYIGDEIIVTWSPAAGGAAPAALDCLVAIEEALARRRADYAAAFGAVPRLRAALHAGPVVVGEIGQAKREIVILGDTMNAAARIEELCRDLGRDYIASAPALAAAGPLPAALRLEPLGPVRLRGKEETLELFALSQQVPEPHAAPTLAPAGDREPLRSRRDAAEVAAPGAPAP